MKGLVQYSIKCHAILDYYNFEKDFFVECGIILAFHFVRHIEVSGCMIYLLINSINFKERQFHLLIRLY